MVQLYQWTASIARGKNSGDGEVQKVIVKAVAEDAQEATTFALGELHAMWMYDKIKSVSLYLWIKSLIRTVTPTMQKYVTDKYIHEGERAKILLIIDGNQDKSAKENAFIPNVQSVKKMVSYRGYNVFVTYTVQEAESKYKHILAIHADEAEEHLLHAGTTIVESSYLPNFPNILKSIMDRVIYQIWDFKKFEEWDGILDLVDPEEGPMEDEIVEKEIGQTGDLDITRDLVKERLVRYFRDTNDPIKRAAAVCGLMMFGVDMKKLAIELNDKEFVEGFEKSTWHMMNDDSLKPMFIDALKEVYVIIELYSRNL